MLPNIGITELIIVLIIILLIFGPKNLPKIGQALGKSLREFKNATRSLSEDDEEESHPNNKKSSADSKSE
jgi:sec-independent protein translocase protein TatA